MSDPRVKGINAFRNGMPLTDNAVQINYASDEEDKRRRSPAPHFYPDVIDGLILPGYNHSMEPATQLRCIAFEGSSRIAIGTLLEVVPQVKNVIDRGESDPILLFDAVTSEPIEIDFRGTQRDVARRLAAAFPSAALSQTVEDHSEDHRGPGRPKLGVVAREVTLLPRHWEWLSQQPGGASVTIRKLVEHARRLNEKSDAARRAKEYAYRFMAAMAGNEPGYEEAIRALFADNLEGFKLATKRWPNDVRAHARELTTAAFELGRSSI